MSFINDMLSYHIIKRKQMSLKIGCYTLAEFIHCKWCDNCGSCALLGSYCEQIYEAVLLATTRSLVTLAESSGCDGKTVRAASAMSDAPSSHYGRSTPRPRYELLSAQ